MSYAANVGALLERWEAGEVARYEVVNGILDLLTRDNIVEVIESLPAEWHQTMVDELLDAARVEDTSQLITLWCGMGRWETEPDAEKREAMRREHEQQARSRPSTLRLGHVTGHHVVGSASRSEALTVR